MVSVWVCVCVCACASEEWFDKSTNIDIIMENNQSYFGV